MGGQSKGGAVSTRGGAKMPRFTWPIHFAGYQQFRFYFIALVLGALLTLTCGKEFFANSNVRSCVCDGEFDQEFDYFADKAFPTLSNDWRVEYRKSYKIVTSRNHVSYLYLCGTPPPEVDTSDPSVNLVSIPVQRVGVDSSTAFHPLEYIAQRGSLRYYDSQVEFVTNACLQLKAEQDDVLDTDDIDDADDAGIDAFFVSPFNYDFAPNEYDQLTVPVVVENSTSQPEVLAQAEWVKFFSLFFNREKAANSVFGRIVERYECHRDGIQAKIIQGSLVKPKVASFGFYAISNDAASIGFDIDCSEFNESTPLGFFDRTSLASPDLEFVSDAGGESIGVTEPYITIGDYFQGISDADVILYKQDMRDVKVDCRAKLLELLNETKAWRDDRVYDIFKTVGAGGTDWFEGKSAEPDLALLDHVAVFFPSELPDHERTFLRLVSGPDAEDPFVETAAACEDLNAPLFTGWKEVACAQDDDLATIVGIEPVESEDICSPSFALPQNCKSLALVLFGLIALL